MYILNNNIHFNESDFRTIEEIPVGNWLIMYNEMTDEYYLKAQSEFVLPKKLYGNCKQLTDKFLYTFKKRKKNLGILLSGLKGTGKSLLSRNVCIESGLPVIILTQAYQGTTFTNFLNKINQECIIFLDEFEKVYHNSDDNSGQNSLLSILDGVFTNKFLFLLTINDSDRLSEFLINRPGRIHYHIKYEGLDISIINDVIDDILDKKENKDKVVQICNYLGEISMDILTSIIEECNIFPDHEPKELIKDMNLECSNTYYDYVVTDAKSGEEIHEGSSNRHPLIGSYFQFEYYKKSKKSKKGSKSKAILDEYDEEVYDSSEGNSQGQWTREYIHFNDENNVAEITFENNAIRIKNSTFIVDFVKTKKFKFAF